MEFIYKNYKWIGIVFIFLILGSICSLKDGFIINNSLDIWFVQNDNVYDNYVDFRERYANDEVVVIYVKNEIVYDLETIEKVFLMNRDFNELCYVQSVFSFIDAPYIAGTSTGPRMTRLLPSIPKTEAQLQNFKNRIESIPHYKNTFFDKKEEGFLLYVMLESPANSIVDPEVVKEIKQIALSNFSNVHFGGIPIINDALNKTAASESQKVSALSVLAIILLLFVFLRNWRYVLISVFSVVIPVIWLFGVYTFFGGSLNMVTLVIPTLLLITGTATSIHIINICDNFFVDSESSVKDTLKIAIEYVFWPCFFTASTTMAGFAALMLSPIPAIKETGFLAAIGVALVFVCSFFVTIVAFLLFPPQKSKRSYMSSKTPVVLDVFDKVNKTFPHLVLAVFPAVIIIALVLIPFVEIKTNPFDYLNKKSAAYIDNNIIEENVGPFLPVELLLIKDSSPFDADDIFKINEFKNELSQKDFINNVFSPVDIISYLNSAIYKLENHIIPKNKNITNRLINIYRDNRADMSQQYDNDEFTELRISAYTYISTSDKYEVILDTINQIFNNIFEENDKITLSPRGYLPMYVEMNNQIVYGQIRTFGVAFFLILALIVVCFRSFKLAVLSLFPNLFPIALILIVMVFSEIPFEHSTAVITCIVLGIAFDDSIHLIYAYRKSKKKRNSSSSATDIALNRTGSAMISTSISLFAGFLIIATSSINGLAYFGLLCSVAVIGSLIGNLWLLPALLKKIK